jgi:hypothetical protein
LPVLVSVLELAPGRALVQEPVSDSALEPVSVSARRYYSHHKPVTE